MNRPEREAGEALIEFTAVIMLVVLPAIYTIITVLTLVAASFATTAGASAAMRILIADPKAHGAANYAVTLAVSDQGLAGSTEASFSCAAECEMGDTVTVTVTHLQPLPGLPTWLAGASHLQIPVTATRVGVIYRGDEL